MKTVVIFVLIVMSCYSASAQSEREGKEETLLNRLDLSVNKINLVHRKYPLLNGSGIVVSIKENKPDSSDIDLKGRFLSTPIASPGISSHASIMATMIAGGGNSWYLGKGAAWGGTISSASFAVLMPESNSFYQQNTITVQNHSYGVGVESFYGADAAAYDASAISNPSLLHVFSSGNSGTLAAGSGTYANIPGFANLTGSFKMAKNTLAVGATDSFQVVVAQSSRGPAHDGRVKPELVAFGEDGSSGAAALVSGTTMILQQAYAGIFGSLPSNALMRAILINSADDAGIAEVDHTSGFGSLNADKALQGLLSSRYMTGNVSQGNIQSFNISIPAGIKKLKVTLSWNDPPAAANASKALINDLDLEVLSPAAINYKPWVLSSFPNRDSLLLPATRKRDSLNNNEQVTIDLPLAGSYQISVKGFAIPSGTQTFYVAYQLDSLDVFEWQFPTSNDFIFRGTSNTIRWRSSFAATTGTIEYSTDNGNSWQLLQSNVALNTEHLNWNTPAITSTALLRMTIGANRFVSDTFTISQRTETGVGFNCPDSFMVYWTKIPGVTDYRFYMLEQKYLEPKFVTSASQLVLSKANYPSHYFAVAPIIGNMEGVKSYTLDYTNAGVGCYIRSFIGVLVNNAAELTLELGTLYNVSSIALEKFDGLAYHQIQQVSPTGLQTIFTDAQLKKGMNVYRVKIILSNGSFVYSDAVTVYNFNAANYLVFPNPVRQHESIRIFTDITEIATVEVFNSSGQKLYQQIIDVFNRDIPASKLGKGLYFIRVTGNTSGRSEVFKIVVL